MTAAEAVAHFISSKDTLGHQVLIGRPIQAAEIRSIRPAPPIVGWRYYPEAKGRQAFYQPPGTIKARRITARIAARHDG